ncbi:hypothetical protein ANCCAN_10780, partial [Ancylostoma caninum]
MAAPMARRLKQEHILKKERQLMEEEAEERKQSRSGEAAVEVKAGERRRRKEKQDLQINERAALKEMSELYRDLLERFEELKQRQDSQ